MTQSTLKVWLEHTVFADQCHRHTSQRKGSPILDFQNGPDLPLCATHNAWRRQERAEFHVHQISRVDCYRKSSTAIQGFTRRKISGAFFSVRARHPSHSSRYTCRNARFLRKCNSSRDSEVYHERRPRVFILVCAFSVNPLFRIVVEEWRRRRPVTRWTSSDAI